MFFIFLLIFYAKGSDLDDSYDEILICQRKISLGAAYPQNDVFNTIFLPGLHTKTVQNLDIEDSFFSSRVVLWQCESNKTEDRNELNSTFSIKSLPLTRDDINQYKILKDKEPYANLLVDGIKQHIKLMPDHADERLYQQENGYDTDSVCVYTKFHIILHEDGNRCYSFYFTVSSEELSVLEEGKQIEYKFEIERMPIIPTIPKRMTQSSFEYLFISIILFIALLIIIVVHFLMRRKVHISVLDYMDIWSITPYFKVTVIFSGFGLECLFYAIFLYLTKNTQFSFEDVLLQNIVLSIILATLWINVLGTVFHVHFSFKQSLIPMIFTALVVVIPQQILLLSHHTSFDSLVGMSIFKTIGIDILIFSTTAFAVHGAMMSGQILKLPFEIETTSEHVDDLNLSFDKNGLIQTGRSEKENKEQYKRLKNNSHNKLVLFLVVIVYSAALAFFSRRFISQLIDTIFTFRKFNISNVIAAILYALSLGGLTGYILAWFSVKQRINNWMDHHLFRYITSFVIILLYFISSSNNYEFGSKWTIMNYYFYVVLFSLFLASVGLFGTVLFSSMAMIMYFSQNKID